MRERDLNALLQEWAIGYPKQHGFATSTTLHRAKEGGASGDFSSSVPIGVPNYRRPPIKRLERIFDEWHNDPERQPYEKVIKYHYLVGPGLGANELEMKPRDFRRLRKKGMELLGEIL